MPAGVVEAFGSGVPAFAGEPVPDGLAAGTTLGVGDGDATATTGLLMLTLGADSVHAPSAAAADKIEISTNDLLIVLFYSWSVTGYAAANGPRNRHHSRSGVPKASFRIRAIALMPLGTHQRCVE